MVMDTTTNYGLPAPAAGTPAADYDTEFAAAMGAADTAIADPTNLDVSGTPSATTFLRGDGTWATPAGAGGGGGLATIQYVRPDGDDGDDGQTWDTAKQTISAAEAEIDTAIPAETQGGTIILSRGLHQCNGVVANAQLRLVGQGQRATYVVVDSADAVGLTLQGEGSVVRDLAFLDDVSGGHAQGAVLIDEAQDVVIDGVTIEEFGAGDTGGQAAATRPYGLKIQGGTAYADWNKIVNCRFKGNYTGLLLQQQTANCNGFVANCDFYGNAEAEHIYHDGGDSWSFHGLWLASGPAGGYQIRLVDGGGCKFTNMHHELSASAAPGDHFYYVGTSRNMFQNIFMNGGGHLSTVTPIGMFFATGTVDNQVGQHMVRSNGEGAAIFQAEDATAASNNYVLDVAADYTATIGT